jgi:multiple sugar transport system ATP-binding protein
MNISGVSDRKVYIGIRPEGFVLSDNGAFECNLERVEVLGRDISVVSTNKASLNPVIRAIIGTENKVDTTKNTVKFNIKPYKMFLFDKETEERIPFEAQNEK